MGGIVDSIKDAFSYILYNTVYTVLYYGEIALCMVIQWMQGLFDAFSGVSTISYNGEPDYLINVFFGNRVINAIYWAMAIIGIVMIIAFSIVAVVRHIFDIDGKHRTTNTQILRSMFRGILMILCMNIVMTISVNFSNALMESVDIIFKNAYILAEGDPHIDFTDEDFAAMSRILNTVGNYSLNPSYKSRYNMNACYNAIRKDLKYLGDHKVFNFRYTDTNEETGKKDYTWQYAIEQIALAADYNKEQPIDMYNERISQAIEDCMDLLKNNPNLHALEYYDRKQFAVESKSAPLDRTLFLMGTMGNGNTAAALNDRFNEHPDINDALRAPYYKGERSIYSLSQVNKDFDIGITKTNYLVVYMGAILLISNLAIIIVDCAVRIFNLLFLYIVAPPIIATAPLDNGGQFQQWTRAFIVQLFAVFGTVISMRLFLIFVPIVLDPSLKLSDSSIINMIGKLVMVWAGTKAVNKANGMLTGILSGMGGEASARAADASHEVRSSGVGKAAAAVKNKFEQGVVKGVTKTAGVALRAGTLPIRPVTGAIKNAGKWVAQGFRTLEGMTDNSILKSPEKSMHDKADARKKEVEDSIISNKKNDPPPPERIR